VSHNARYGVTPRQVEEVCQGDCINRLNYKDRLLFIGPTRAGPTLAVVLAPEGEDTFYVITARPADRKERREIAWREERSKMTRRKKVEPIPEFKSREEEAAFWNTHSFADYWEQMEPVKVRLAKHLSEGLPSAWSRIP
jgi:uncharacterized DUF497 family protein